MTDSTSSCRPARLTGFEETIDAIADGLARRRGLLLDALDAYRHACNGDYEVPTSGTATVVRTFGRGLRDWGHWVGDIGRAFLQVDSEFVDIDAGDRRDFSDPEAFVVSISRDDLLMARLEELLDPGDDPYRGIPAGSAADYARDLGVAYDQDEPPAWIGVLDAGGNTADVMAPLLEDMALALARRPEWRTISVRVEGASLMVDGERAVATAFAAELRARIGLPNANASRLASAARWASRVGPVLGALGAGTGQWNADAGMGTAQRAGRTITRAGLVTAGGAILPQVVSTAACGPAAPACAVITAFAGASAGNLVADLLPFMQEQDDLATLTDRVAAEDAGVDAPVAAMVDLRASDLALEATGDEPIIRQEVAGLLPDRDVLRRVLETGQARPAPATTPTGTMVPAIPQPATGAADPWVAARPYE